MYLSLPILIFIVVGARTIMSNIREKNDEVERLKDERAKEAERAAAQRHEELMAAMAREYEALKEAKEGAKPEGRSRILPVPKPFDVDAWLEEEKLLAAKKAAEQESFRVYQAAARARSAARKAERAAKIAAGWKPPQFIGDKAVDKVQ